MTYALTDLVDGAPVHLFQFNYENTDYRFTNVKGGYTALGYNWSEKGIKMGNVETTEEMNKNNLDLDFSRDDSFGSLFLSEQQDNVTSVTVYRGYHNDNDSEFIALWKGRVASNQERRNLITLTCESIFTSLKRPGLRGRYSKTCRHSLYNRGCNIDPDQPSPLGFYDEDIVSDVSADGLTLTINAASLKANGYYRGGMLRAPDGVHRFIKAHDGDQITVSKPHVGFVASDGVFLYPGCDRSTNICLNRFDNLDNFGGFPYVPSKNPFDGTRL